MSSAAFYKLNNPAWYALAETHRHFAIGTDTIKRYLDTIAPFAACLLHDEEIILQPDQWIQKNESFFIVGDLPNLPANYIIESRLLCVQMICNEIKIIAKTTHIETLGESDNGQMTSLINLVQPGYYKPGTRLMGDYFGIRENDRLVAMTGERMRMDGFTEISAVVTHPDFTGRTYAQQLVAHAAAKNIAAGVIPFLHTAENNERAIKIYEYLGFVQRRVIAFWKIKRAG